MPAVARQQAFAACVTADYSERKAGLLVTRSSLVRSLGLERMQLAILTAVLAALAAAETDGGPVTDVAWRLLVIAAAGLVAPAAALVGSWTLDRRGDLSPAADGRLERAASRLQSLVVGLWIAGGLVVLFVAQWPRIVRGNWQL